MRKKRGELAAGFAANNWYERDELAVQPGLADEQTGGDGHANPAIFQNIHGKAGAAGDQIAVDAQIIVHTRERRFDWRRFRFAFGGICTRVERAVLFDRQNDPSGRMHSGLSERIGRARK
jgi:hypothetical protein